MRSNAHSECESCCGEATAGIKEGTLNRLFCERIKLNSTYVKGLCNFQEIRACATHQLKPHKLRLLSCHLYGPISEMDRVNKKKESPMFKHCPAYRSSPPPLLYFIHQGATLWLCLGAEEAGDGASKLPHVKTAIEVGVLEGIQF